MKRTVCLLAAALAAGLPAASQAESWSEAINGATCIPYPAFDDSNALPYAYLLYGFRQSAYCHFAVPDDWSVRDIAYVLFSGGTDSGSEPLRVRLCVHSTPRSVTACGAVRTIPPGFATVDWVTLPASMPSHVAGAYLAVNFPSGQISVLSNFMPVLIR